MNKRVTFHPALTTAVDTPFDPTQVEPQSQVLGCHRCRCNWSATVLYQCGHCVLCIGCARWLYQGKTRGTVPCFIDCCGNRGVRYVGPIFWCRQ